MRFISKAVAILKKGGVVVFPTETAYGIGCRMDNKKAIRRLIKIRRREKGKPFLILVSGLEMAKRYLKDLPSEVRVGGRTFGEGAIRKEEIKKEFPRCKAIPIPDRKDGIVLNCGQNNTTVFLCQ